MDFNVPKKFSIGSVDYNVKQLDYVNHGEDFGVWRYSGDIELANNISGDKVSESKKETNILTWINTCYFVPNE